MENTKNANGIWTRPFVKGDRVFYTMFAKDYFGTILVIHGGAAYQGMLLVVNSPSEDLSVLVYWDDRPNCVRWEDPNTFDRA
jgi:predicted membrane GTPase involved in stress response